jgi:hypothetical protein
MVLGSNDLHDTALHILYHHLLQQPAHSVNDMINNAYMQPLTIQKVYHMIGVNDTTGLYQFTDSKGTPTYKPSSLTDRTVIINSEKEVSLDILQKLDSLVPNGDVRISGNLVPVYFGLIQHQTHKCPSL